MAESDKIHSEKVAELEAVIQEKQESNSQLARELTLEKLHTSKLEEQRSDLLKKYEEEKALWHDSNQKLDIKLSKQQGQFRERVPFDPFSNSQVNILNAIKSDSKTRDKQVEIVVTLKQLVDPTSA